MKSLTPVRKKSPNYLVEFKIKMVEFSLIILFIIGDPKTFNYCRVVLAKMPEMEAGE